MNIAEKVKNFAVIYVVDIDEVPEFNGMYELYDPCTTMFFYRNKHIMVDLGTGNNNKINWALADKQEMIDIIEVRIFCLCALMTSPFVWTVKHFISNFLQIYSINNPSIISYIVVSK